MFKQTLHLISAKLQEVGILFPPTSLTLFPPDIDNESVSG